jgi:hypothetical protein
MPETIRTQLTNHYRPHNERLTTWLGHPPSWHT